MKKTVTTTLMMIGLLGFGSNAVAAASAGPYYQKNGTQAADTRPGMPCEPGMRHHQGNAGFRMNDRLNLSAEQRTRFVELRRKYFGQSTNGRSEMIGLQRELAVESLKRTPDQKKIEGLAEAIGREHTKLARTQSRFFNELSSILTPDQLQTFLKMKEHRFRGRNS
ncbi:MAG: periplasmic heavy metal sensor [Chlorobiaceae bacterium]|nr:periplasmic heavy metal sensor [Chlorobiaceae bacterium]